MILFSGRTDGLRRISGFSFAILLLLCCAGNSFGQETVHLSPSDAVEYAVRNNLSLENARIDLNNKQRTWDLVWNQFLPSVTLGGTISHSAATETTIMGMTINPTSATWTIAGQLSVTLDFSFALVAGIQTIKSNYQAGIVTYEKARLQTERDIRKLYNQILLLQENVVLLNDNYAHAERQAATAEANYRAGLVPRLTWLQAQVQVENLRPTITEMENSLKALQANFAFMLGLPYDTVFDLEPLSVGDFQIPLDLADLISRAASGKPDIMELQRNIAVLQNTRKARALMLYTPSIRLGWDINLIYRDGTFDNLFTWDNWIKNKGGTFSIVLGYSLNTLFPFTKEGQSLVDIDNQIKGLNINLAQLIAGTELEIFTKVNSLEKTQTSLEVQRAAVELAELAYSLTEEAYNAGLQDLLAVQNSALALRQARAQLFSQQFNYLNDLIDLEYAVGVPFGTLSSLY